MVLQHFLTTLVGNNGVWTASLKIFRSNENMAIFKVKNEENGDQQAKNVSSSLSRRKYDRYNPRTNNEQTRLSIQDKSRSNDLKTNYELKSSF